MSSTESLWRATHELPNRPSLAGDVTVDVAIVGGGISGLTAAVILGRAGKRVALLERDRIGSGETGNTTSHLTEAVDARYMKIARDFGADAAQLVAKSSREAISWIEKSICNSVQCGFQRLPGYLYTERESHLDWLAEELDAARRAGCQVEWDDRPPLPFKTHGAVRWDNQGQIHATVYLAELLNEAVEHGVQIFEGTRVVGVHDAEPCRVETERGTVRAAQVFVAANVPINNRVLLHTKIAAYRSYAMAAESGAPEYQGLLWDTEDPYHYTRWQRVAGRNYLIVGGEDHRTGDKTDTEACFDRLATYMRDRFGLSDAEFRWSGQIIEPVDGLPFIGRNAVSENVYVATGYSGNGMTFGTLAGMIVSDLILGRPNAYAALYDATRIKPVAAALEYVKENLTFPTQLITNRLTSLNTEDGPVQGLKAGEGGIFDSDEGKIAVCRDAQNVIHACSAVCTHLGCDVAWNGAEQTWDCPCHGSRFTPDGTVLNGPAVSDLRRVPVTTTR